MDYMPQYRDSRLELFLDLVKKERHRQRKLWGDQYEKQDGVWHMILGEEYGEVANAFLENKTPSEIQDELIQTAAVCLAWCEAISYRQIHLPNKRSAVD